MIHFDFHRGLCQSEENKHGATRMWIVCSNTSILFWLTKTSVKVEMYQSSFCELFWFICAFHLETSSFPLFIAIFVLFHLNYWSRINEKRAARQYSTCSLLAVAPDGFRSWQNFRSYCYIYLPRLGIYLIHKLFSMTQQVVVQVTKATILHYYQQLHCKKLQKQ